MASKQKLTRAEILAKARAAKKLKHEERQEIVSQLSNRIRGKNNIIFSKPPPTTHKIHEIDIPDYTQSYDQASTYKSYVAFNKQKPVYNNAYKYEQVNSDQHYNKQLLLNQYLLRCLKRKQI